MGAAIGGALGGLFSRSAASSAAATGALLGAGYGETRLSARERYDDVKERSQQRVEKIRPSSD